MPTLQQLLLRNNDHQTYAKHWDTAYRLCVGGTTMDDQTKAKLLINPDGCNNMVQNERLKVAMFDPVVGAIILKLVSQLMRDSANYEGSDDPYWADVWLKENVAMLPEKSGKSSWQNFLSAAMLQAVSEGAAIAQIDTTPGEALTRAEQSEFSGDRPYVILRRRGDLWDWAQDDTGYCYAKLHTYREYRKAWDQPLTRVHEFVVYYKEDALIYSERYEVQLAKDAAASSDRDLEDFSIKRLSDLGEGEVIITTALPKTQIFTTTSGVAKFPVVSLELPMALCLGLALYDLQVSFFRQDAANEWACLQTMYATQVFEGVEDAHVEGNNNPAKGVQQGDGYYLELPPGVTVKWHERSPDGLKFGMEKIRVTTERIYEKISQIAESVASGYSIRMQSGFSKQMQGKNLDLLLELYGDSIREFAEQVMNVAAIVRDEVVHWEVDGYTDYDTSGLSEDIKAYLEISSANISSPSLTRALQKGIASKAIQFFNADPSVLEATVSELKEQPFSLTDGQRDDLTQAMLAGHLSPVDYFEILQKAGAVPADFNVMEAMERMGYGNRQTEPENAGTSLIAG